MRLSTYALINILDELSLLVKAGDSLEGSIEYSAVGPREWEVAAAYRVGNLEGQGGMRLVKASPPEHQGWCNTVINKDESEEDGFPTCCDCGLGPPCPTSGL